MRVLELGKYKRTRIWIGSLPDAHYPSQQTLSLSLAANKELIREPRLAAVELLIVTGPRSLYGLLGGLLKSDATDRLCIDVSVSSPDERLFGDALTIADDEVRVGLPAEYAQAVLDGAKMAKEQLNLLAPGSLTINCAAHGVASSCEMIYKHLAAILVKLINTPSHELSDEDLVRLFPTTFN